MSHRVVFALLAVSAVSLSVLAEEAKFKPIWPDEPGMGINVNPTETNPWRARSMAFPTEIKADMKEPLAPDFFTAEFGEPASFAFEETPDKKVYEGVRFCRGWGKFECSPIRIEMEVKQSVPETTWNISALRQDFQVKTAVTGVWEKVVVDISFKRHMKDSGRTLTVACKTEGAQVAVRNLKVYPCDAKLLWRAELPLAAKPHRAGVTYGHHDNYTFRINGKTVAKGTGVFSQGVHRKDVTDFFQAGTNVIEFATLNANGYSPSGLLMELFTVADDGTTTFLDESAWRVRVKGGAWVKPRYPSNPKFRYGGEQLADGTPHFQGVLPLHGGALAVKPHGEKYPVFDYDTGAVWDADVPPAVKDPVITCIVSNALTGSVAKEVRVRVGVRERNLTTSSAGQDGRARTPAAPPNGGPGVSALPAGQRNEERDIHSRTPTYNSNSSVRISGLKTGAYLLHWTLTSAGKVIDSFENEMVIAGPLDQDIVPKDKVEPLLDSRLRLIQEVDCTKEPDGPDRFLDHISMWWTCKRGSNEKRPLTGNSRVVEEQGIRFREAGICGGDWFGYKLDIKNLGKLHVVDVFYPETRDAKLFSGINEAFPCAFCNNHAAQGNYYCNASGSVRSGWRTPKRAGVGKLRYVFWPGSKNCCITFENANANWTPGAGVCSFKVYEVDGRLPGMKLPKTDKVFAIHAERPLWAPWSASVNAVRRAGWSGLDRLAYAASFAGASHRVEYLRYAGINTALEGVYMYMQGFPTDSGASFHTDQDFDDMYVFAKLCKHNGLRLYGCFEYISSPDLFAQGHYDASERDVVAGRAKGIQCMNKDGQEQYGHPGLVLNPFAPEVRKSINNLTKEIYERYAPTKAFEGLVVIAGGYWLPGFPSPHGLGDVEDYGFEDWTVAEFEKETGIRLGVNGTSPDRFAKRAELLLGKCRQEWFTWRSKRMKACLEEMSDACGNGAWKIVASSQFKRVSWKPDYKQDVPVRERLRAAGYDPSLYPKDGKIRCLVRRETARGGWENDSVSNVLSAASMDVYRENGGAYLAPGGIEERPLDTKGVTRWWWRYACNGVYDMKPAGDEAFFDVRKLVEEANPDFIIHKWTDCNYTTGHAEESRRALYDYYTKGAPKFGTWIREKLRMQ